MDDVPEPVADCTTQREGYTGNYPAVFSVLHNTDEVICRQWVDIFSSLSRPQPPKFLSLWQTLLSGDQSNFWMNGSDLDIRRLRMDLLTGCPDEVMLAIAETSSLSQWKALQQRNNCLSYPELIRRGNNIEQQLRQHQSEQLQGGDTSQTRLHASANVTLEDHRLVIANIFRETAILYLHTVLSNALPGKHI